MATIKQHIESAAGKIESVMADFKEAFDSLKQKYLAAVAAAKKPEPVPVEDADTEFALLDNAMNNLGQLASEMRGAATTVGNSAGNTDIGAVGVGTRTTGGGTPAPTSDPTAGNPPVTTPSGSQETGPTGDSHAGGTEAALPTTPAGQTPPGGQQPATFPGGTSGQQSSPAATSSPQVAREGVLVSDAVSESGGGVTPLPGDTSSPDTSKSGGS